ncbi:MAG: adenosylcobinamide-GDP ribazoletransferase [bacterium]|nr:adenosylcobinamide-GDP ribazoletransferase [bacterium]
MKSLIIALQFLTVIPVKVKGNIDQTDYSGSMKYFPFTGVIIGFISALPALMEPWVSRPVIVIFILVISFIVTGAVHLDGLADTCDGFYGIRTKEERIRIMRDSSVGAMGVLGIISIVLIKYSFLICMPVSNLFYIVLLMTVFSRWSQVLACFSSKYAAEKGTGKFYIGQVRLYDLLISAVFTLFVSVYLTGFINSLIIFVILIIITLLFTLISKSKTGGMTGDNIGAISEIAEAAVIFTLYILTLIVGLM